MNECDTICCRRSSMVWYQGLTISRKHEEASSHPCVHPAPAASGVGPQPAGGRLGLRRCRRGQWQWQLAYWVRSDKSSCDSRSIRSLRARIVVQGWQEACLSGRKSVGRVGFRRPSWPCFQNENTTASFFGKCGFLRGKPVRWMAIYSSGPFVIGKLFDRSSCIIQRSFLEEENAGIPPKKNCRVEILSMCRYIQKYEKYSLKFRRIEYIRGFI